MTERGDLEFETIPRLVEIAATRQPDADAIVDVDAGVSRTYAEFATDVLTAARAYAASGIGPGDRVAVWAPNIWEWPVAALGAQAAGGVLVPLNRRFKGAEAAYVLRRSGAKALITVNGFLDTDYVAMLQKAASEEPLPDLATIVVARGD